MPRALLVMVGSLLLVACLPSLPEGAAAGAVEQGAGACGSGSWRPGWLEIHHIDAGEAVSTLVVAPTGRSLLIDAGEATWDASAGAATVGDYVRTVLGCAALDYVVVSHFHLDHVGYPGYGGLWHLLVRQGFAVGTLFHRDLDGYVGVAGSTLLAWRSFLHGDAAQLTRPERARIGVGQVDLGADVRFAFVAVDGVGGLRAGDFSAEALPPDENDYSIALLLRMGRLDYFAAGDLSGETLAAPSGGYSYHDIETAVAARVKDVDIYRVSHHGSSHASNPTLLAQLAPRVAILAVGDGNGSRHPAQATVDHLLARGALYLTQHGDPATRLDGAAVVGHVVVRSADGVAFTVNGDRYTASDPSRTDADGDDYFAEADPDDGVASLVPPANGGCDPAYQVCR